MVDSQPKIRLYLGMNDCYEFQDALIILNEMLFGNSGWPYSRQVSLLHNQCTYPFSTLSALHKVSLTDICFCIYVHTIVWVI